MPRRQTQEAAQPDHVDPNTAPSPEDAARERARLRMRRIRSAARSARKSMSTVSKLEILIDQKRSEIKTLKLLLKLSKKIDGLR